MKMAAKINLVLGSHAHVPYGADATEFEKVYANLLLPFVSSLNKFSKIQAVLHYSGVLLHWVERSHPELLMSIEDMISRKQVEILGGGFYEPMLPIIPSQDKIGQIELFTTYLRKQFGKRPQGCWIPAFAWEQNLVSPLAACGMNYTFLSERQFASAGAPATSPCICEDQGKLITVFPVLQSMEASLAATDTISVLLENFRKKRPDGTELVFSIFPQKLNSVYGKSNEIAWSRFFEELSQCEQFAETTTPGKLIKSVKGVKRVCFPDSSSLADNMSSRRFIIAHPEAGGIYSKMVFTNVLINQLRGDKSRKLSAHEELWKSQGSVLFSQTGINGVCNPLLRNAAYGALLGAERITREKTKFTPSLISFDFNMDGTDEWLFQEAKINCYVQSMGGGIFELDYLPKAWNYLNTCGNRLAFADRLLPSALKLEKLISGDIDGARMCRGECYEPGDLDKVRRKLTLMLPPSSQKTIPPFGNIEIKKTFVLKKDAITAGYSLSNSGTVKEVFQFAPEIDLSFSGEGVFLQNAPLQGDAFARFFACKSGEADSALAQPVFRGVDSLKIHDLKNEVQISLLASQPFDGKLASIYIPDAETGTKLFQAFCIMPFLPVSLEGGGKWEVEFTLRFSH